MTIAVPPSSAHDAAPAALERLARFSGGDKGSEPALPGKPVGSNVILIISCVLSALGIVLLACAVALVCLPQSAPARLLMLAFEALGAGECEPWMQ